MNASAIRVITGVVVYGDGRGRKLGFPTANVQCGPLEVPDDGIYAAWVRIDEDSHSWAGSVSIGTNPTFATGQDRRVEVHLHDVDLDLYGRKLAVQLMALLRPMLRFDAVEDLIAQTAADIDRCRTLLGEQSRSQTTLGRVPSSSTRPS